MYFYDAWDSFYFLFEVFMVKVRLIVILKNVSNISNT